MTSIRYINPIADRDAWLDARTHGLGGSDAGVIMGWDPYRDADQLFREKVGIHKKDLEGNPYVFWGSMLEDALAEAYAQNEGVRVLARDRWGRPCIFTPEPSEPPQILSVREDWEYIIHRTER